MVVLVDIDGYPVIIPLARDKGNDVNNLKANGFISM